MWLGKGLRGLLSFYPSSGPQALLQSPGPSPGPFINGRNARLPCPGTFATTNPGGAFCGEEVPLCARGGSRTLAGRRRQDRSRALVEGGGHGMGDAGPRGPRAATAAIGALLVRRSSKLCKSLGRGWGAFSLSPHLFLHQPSQAPDQVSWGRKVRFPSAHGARRGRSC